MHRQIEYRPDQDAVLSQLMDMTQAQCQQQLAEPTTFWASSGRGQQHKPFVVTWATMLRWSTATKSPIN